MNQVPRNFLKAGEEVMMTTLILINPSFIYLFIYLKLEIASVFLRKKFKQRQHSRWQLLRPRESVRSKGQRTCVWAPASHKDIPWWEPTACVPASVSRKTLQTPSPSADLGAISRSKQHGALSQPACTSTLLGDIYLLAAGGGEGERLTNSIAVLDKFARRPCCC